MMTNEEAQRKALELCEEYAKRHLKICEEKRKKGIVHGLGKDETNEEIKMNKELERKIRELFEQIDE